MCKKRVHLLCRDTLEVFGEHTGGLSPTFTHLQLKLLLEFTHPQFEDPLTHDALKDYEDLSELDLYF